MFDVNDGRTSPIGWLLAVMMVTGCGTEAPAEKQLVQATEHQRPPNILLIVADDLGFSDIGPFGGEIRTPNLDALAERGQAFSQFYAAPTCSPSRSQLLSGRDNHTAGIGTMEEWLAVNQQGQWGYEGQISERVTTLAEALGAGGYFTAMAGKWHLGHDPAADPSARGFQKSFSLTEGLAPHFRDTRPVHPGAAYTYRLDGQPAGLPEDFYSTRFYTDQIIEFLRSREKDQPFFAYLAYTAPHDPLQVPDEWLDRYRGAYDAGYEDLRARRLQKLVELGVVPATGLPPLIPWVRPWASLTPEQHAVQVRRMELYAAMVEYMDGQIGRVLGWLGESGELDNTLVVFFSDNGANGSVMATYPGSSPQWIADNLDNATGNLGRAGSALAAGPGWAQASMTPFLFYKGFMSEGGVRVPAIFAGPGVTGLDGFNPAVASVRDLYPTLLEAAGIDAAATADDGLPASTRGRSILRLLSGSTESGADRPPPFIQELFNGKMVRSGRWKALYQDPPFGPGRWQLFDMNLDVTELADAGPQHPEVLQQMIRAYEEYATAVRVIEPPFKPADIINKTLDPNDLARKPGH